MRIPDCRGSTSSRLWAPTGHAQSTSTSAKLDSSLSKQMSRNGDSHQWSEHSHLHQHTAASEEVSYLMLGMVLPVPTVTIYQE